LDDDVAARLRKLQGDLRLSFKDLVNRVLREGLGQLEGSRQPLQPFTLETRDLGACLLPNLDNLAEVLAVAEGDDFR